MPTQASIRPISTATAVLMGLSPAMPARQTIAKTISMKYSAGPKETAHLASSGAKMVTPMVAIRPPINELQAEMDSAMPPLPCLASGWPSRVVITAEASPGMFSKMEEMRPPYSQPR